MNETRKTIEELVNRSPLNLVNLFRSNKTKRELKPIINN